MCLNRAQVTGPNSNSKMALTSIHEYSYSCDFEDEDQDYDEDVAADAYKTQLTNKRAVDAIVISTFYLDRLTPENIKNLGVCAMIDDDTVTVFGESEDFYDVFNENDLPGLVFKTTDALDTIELIQKLNEIEYCAHCNVPNISEMIWYTVNGKTVLYVSIDTESG